MPGSSSGWAVMTKSVHQHKIVTGGKLWKSKTESSLICVVIAEGSKCLASFHKHLVHFCIPLSSLLAQQECPSSVSDQWHSVAGQRILLFCCHHSLTLGHTLVVVLLWCWKRLPSGGWWWACWRLGGIPWQCSRSHCEQEIWCHAHVYPLFHWRKPCVLPLLLFRLSSFISFHRVQVCSSCSWQTCPFLVLVPGVSLHLLHFMSLCSSSMPDTPSWCMEEDAVLVALFADEPL